MKGSNSKLKSPSPFSVIPRKVLDTIIDKLQLLFLKFVLRQPEFIPTYSVYLETKRHVASSPKSDVKNMFLTIKRPYMFF